MSEANVVNASPDQYFILKSGRGLKNIYELSNALSGMDDSTFEHHVNSGKNDFANWIKYVFHEDKLADEIYNAKSREQMHRLISRHFSNRGDLKELNIPLLAKKKEKKAATREAQQEVASASVAKPLKTGEVQENRQFFPGLKLKGKLGILLPKQKEQENALPQEEHPEIPNLPQSGSPMEYDFQNKLDSIISREKEIEKREQIIEQIEARIEEQLAGIRQGQPKEGRFFSKEFVQGIAAGFLVTLILSLVFIRFFL